MKQFKAFSVKALQFTVVVAVVLFICAAESIVNYGLSSVGL